MFTAELIINSPHKKDLNNQNEIDSLIAKVKDYDTDAIEVLGEISEPKAVASLLDALKTCPDFSKKIEIVEALRKIGDPQVIKAIVSALKNEHVSEVRMVLAETIEQLST